MIDFADPMIESIGDKDVTRAIDLDFVGSVHSYVQCRPVRLRGETFLSGAGNNLKFFELGIESHDHMPIKRNYDQASVG